MSAFDPLRMLGGVQHFAAAHEAKPVGNSG